VCGVYPKVCYTGEKGKKTHYGTQAERNDQAGSVQAIIS
jgi:hypothetical protein